VSDYLTEDGELDAERIQADALAMIQERPGLSKYDPCRRQVAGSLGQSRQRHAKLGELAQVNDLVAA
jgi:hypothetical protein